MSAAEMLCHQCRKPMTRRADGAWPRCCDGLGYWIRTQALPMDRCGGERNGMTFCPSAGWWRMQQ